MRNCLGNQPIQFYYVIDISPGDKGGACCFYKFTSIHLGFYHSKRSSGGKMTRFGCWCILTTGHTVNFIDSNNGCHVDIAARSVNKMVTANRSSITISHKNNDLQFGVSQLDSCGNSQCPSVSSSDGWKVEITGQSSGTSDSTYHNR